VLFWLAALVYFLDKLRHCDNCLIKKMLCVVNCPVLFWFRLFVVILRLFNFCLLNLFIYVVLGYYIRWWSKAVCSRDFTTINSRSQIRPHSSLFSRHSGLYVPLLFLIYLFIYLFIYLVFNDSIPVRQTTMYLKICRTDLRKQIFRVGRHRTMAVDDQSEISFSAL